MDGERPEPFRSRRPVLVGIDGSADARRALLIAGDAARERGAELVVVHAVGLTDVVEGEHVISERHPSEISEQFDGWCRAVRAVGVDEWTPILRHGNPVDTLLAIARDMNAGLIVVGRHGSGQRRALLLGSTAHQVAERAECPVLIVPPVGRTTSPSTG
jgi:nucleotide-binding universal stress UspA family protein